WRGPSNFCRRRNSRGPGCRGKIFAKTTVGARISLRVTSSRESRTTGDCIIRKELLNASALSEHISRHVETSGFCPVGACDETAILSSDSCRRQRYALLAAKPSQAGQAGAGARRQTDHDPENHGTPASAG